MDDWVLLVWVVIFNILRAGRNDELEHFYDISVVFRVHFGILDVEGRELDLATILFPINGLVI